MASSSCFTLHVLKQSYSSGAIRFGEAFSLIPMGGTCLLKLKGLKQTAQTTIPVSHLQTKVAESLDYLLDVVPGLKLLQQKHSLLGLLVALNFVFNHQWDLWDFLNAVS